MRELTPTRSLIEVKDELGGSIHEFEHRMPTTSERVAYRAGLWRRKDNKVINCTETQRVKYGLKVLTSFKKGTFCVGGKPISCDADDADFCETWKDVLAQGAPELLAEVGRIVFEGAQAIRMPDNLGEMSVEVEELDAPLAS
jgi:hypothetical protein